MFSFTSIISIHLFLLRPSAYRSLYSHLSIVNLLIVISHLASPSSPSASPSLPSSVNGNTFTFQFLHSSPRFLHYAPARSATEAPEIPQTLIHHVRFLAL
jgi:hypothetical protein